MNPYQLLLLIRENRLLFKYFEVGSVVIKEDESWNILGVGEVGESSLRELSSGVLQFKLPISLPETLPISALVNMISILNEDDLEGMCSIEQAGPEPFLFYFLHVTVDNLDEGLQTFYKEKLVIDKNINSIMNMLSKMTSSLMPPKSSMGPSSKSESVWDTLKDIEDKDPLDDEDSEESE